MRSEKDGRREKMERRREIEERSGEKMRTAQKGLCIVVVSWCHFKAYLLRCMMSVLGREHTERVLTASRISPHWGQYHGLSLPSNSLATEREGGEGREGGREEEGERERGRDHEGKGEINGGRAMVESGSTFEKSSPGTPEVSVCCLASEPERRASPPD